MSNAPFFDKILFLIATIGGLVFMGMVTPSQTNTVLGSVVVIGGLVGLLGSQALSNVISVLEKSGSFLQTGATSSSEKTSAASSQKSL